ncbi:hypothetical protein [Odoribacter laneus]
MHAVIFPFAHHSVMKICWLIKVTREARKAVDDFYENSIRIFFKLYGT